MIKMYIEGIAFPDPASGGKLVPKDFKIVTMYNEYKQQRLQFGLETERSYEYFR